MKTLKTNELKKMRDSDGDFELINVLSPEQYEDKHIPGSSNIPQGADDFTEQVERQAGSKDKKIVVYCASTACDASPKAAQKLEDAGFTDVYDYEGGTLAWQQAGLPLEGSEA